jgi:hypothetical protein
MSGWGTVRGEAGGLAMTTVRATGWFAFGALIAICSTCVVLVKLVDKAERGEVVASLVPVLVAALRGRLGRKPKPGDDSETGSTPSS